MSDEQCHCAEIIENMIELGIWHESSRDLLSGKQIHTELETIMSLYPKVYSGVKTT